jgi:aldehyde:ferredoxin oxidoreductase
MVHYTGLTGRIARVDLSQGKVQTIEPGEEIYKTYLGGWSLGMYYMFEQKIFDPDVKPFSPENMFQLMVGPVTGMSPNARTAIVTKSPYNFACVTFCGGQGGANLKFAGWDGIQITGKAQKPVYLAVIDDEIEIRDADEFWGLGAEDAEMAMRKQVLAPLEQSKRNRLTKHDLTDKWAEKRPPTEQMVGAKRLASAWVIGPGGEQQVWYANVITEGARAHGRYGSGAILGSKNVKGIVVRGTKGQRFADKQKFVRLMGNIQQREKKSHFWRKYGTAGISVKEDNIIGGFPIRNWQWESWSDPNTVKALSGPFVEQASWVRKQSCPGCLLHCLYTARVSSRDKLMQGTVTDMPDWEAMGMVGGNLGYLEEEGDTPDDAYRGSHADQAENAAQTQYTTSLFDDYGLDFIEGGAMLAMLMELRQRDIIQPEDLDGIDLSWGDVHAVDQIMQKVVAQKGIGRILAQGTWETARHLSRKKNDESIMYYSMTGHRYAQPAHGTRSNKDRNALEYVTAVRPCEHTGGGSAAFMSDPIDFEAAIEGQNTTAAINSMVYCLFAGGFWGDEGNVELLKAVTGWSGFSKNDFLQVGERAYALTRLFNLYTQSIQDPRREWDCLQMFPNRWFEEPLPTGPYKGRSAFAGDPGALFDKALPLYWEKRGWSRDKGIPSPEKLRELGISNVAEKVAAALR